MWTPPSWFTRWTICTLIDAYHSSLTDHRRARAHDKRMFVLGAGFQIFSGRSGRWTGSDSAKQEDAEARPQVEIQGEKV